jgi:hypothetical protein
MLVITFHLPMNSSVKGRETKNNPSIRVVFFIPVRLIRPETAFAASAQGIHRANRNTPSGTPLYGAGKFVGQFFLAEKTLDYLSKKTYSYCRNYVAFSRSTFPRTVTETDLLSLLPGRNHASPAPEG